MTVTGQDDAVADGDANYEIVLATAVSNDGNYNGLDPDDVSVVNTDNGIPGFTVSAISGNTTEAGGQSTFTVQLNTEPTAEVTIGVASSDTTEGTVSTTSLVFGPVNYDTPQTVTATGIDDLIDDGDAGYTIRLAPATSNDNIYDGMNPRDVAVVNEDDDSAGITVSETAGSTQVDETGTTDQFTVVLDAQPAGNVVLDVSSGDEGEATVAPASLTFTSANWDTPRTVTVTGIDDILHDGQQIATITVGVDQAASSAEYAAAADETVDAVNAGQPDFDGVSGNVEDAAPNGGDGNGDGIPDSQQAHVVSIPDAVTGAYVTLEPIGGCDSFENVSAHTEDEYGTDINYDYPQGLLDFELPCADATVVLYYHGTTMEEAGESYRKFREGAHQGFFALPGTAIGSAVGAGQTVPTATLTLADGQLGDLDNLVNDRIRDPGGMARLNQTIPTLNEYGLMLLALGVGLLGWTKMRKKAGPVR